MPTSKQQLEPLLDSLLPFAKQMLREHGEFLPFGGFISNDDKITHAGASNGIDLPKSNDLISILRSDFERGMLDGKYKATAIVYDIRATPPQKTEPQDCILFELKHREAFQVIVIFPYLLSDDSVEVEPPYAVHEFVQQQRDSTEQDAAANP